MPNSFNNYHKIHKISQTNLHLEAKLNSLLFSSSYRRVILTIIAFNIFCIKTENQEMNQENSIWFILDSFAAMHITCIDSIL